MLRSLSRVSRLKPISRRAFSISLAKSNEASTSATNAASISSPSSTPESKKWTRPLEPGFLPAYDEALAYIEQDSRNLKAELARRREDKNGKWTEAELERLEIESEINLPEIRWNFKQGHLDLSKPVYRHLLNQQWRAKGRLDRLMERVHLMKVVPDVLPAIRPTVDVRIDFSSSFTAESGPISITPSPSTSKIPPKKFAKNLADLAPEDFILPSQSVNPPRVTAQVFHPESRLYTLALIDPDVPDPANQSFQTYLHWLIPNVPLSASSKEVPLPTSPNDAHLHYVPPHPQDGSPSHRYILVLLEQPNSTQIPTSAIPLNDARLGFNLRAFIAEHGLLQYIEPEKVGDGPEEIFKSGETVLQRKKVDVNEGGGIAMWRESWDASVSEIYEKILGIPEPKYRRPKKPNPYLDEEGKKYPKYPTAFPVSSHGHSIVVESTDANPETAQASL